MKDLRDWSKELSGLSDMGTDETNELYAQMLATAHDIGFTVPDNLLIETENVEDVRKVIPDLHAGIVAHHEELKVQAAAKPKPAKAPRATKEKAAATPPVTKSTDKVPTERKTKKSTPKKAAATADQKEPVEEESATMATTAKKTAKAGKAAGGGAKKGAAPKVAAKKSAKGATKSAKDNARTPVVGRSKFDGDQKITIKIDANPAREGSGRFDRVANLMKHNGKTVEQFLKSGGKSATLIFAVNEGWAAVK